MKKQTIQKLKKKIESINAYLLIYGMITFSGLSFIYSTFLMGDLFIRMGYDLNSFYFKYYLEFPVKLFGWWIGTLFCLSIFSIILYAILKNERNFE